MIQVSVSNQNSSDVLFLGNQIRNIWNHVIDTMHIWVRELDTCIYQKDIIFVFDDGRIDSDLIQSSERNYSDRNFIFLDQFKRISHSRLFDFISMTKKSRRGNLVFFLWSTSPLIIIWSSCRNVRFCIPVCSERCSSTGCGGLVFVVEIDRKISLHRRNICCRRFW